MTSFLLTFLYSPIWIGSCKILAWNFFQLYDQSWDIITESYWSKPWSNNEIWFCGMDDLGWTMKGIGIDTDSGIKLKSSLGSRVGVGSWVWIQVHIHFSIMKCDYPK